ncbi:MAG: glycosyltransferase [Candidatus Accumulibacter sp.]|jgi:glycosyltransferase involved in cell wall biosynthesis|nr:glycosyltransferase [Accumulibacter sp.]
MKHILMIAFHFPPQTGSSGIQRTLRFVRHLPEFGWQPIVLSADPRAYERTSNDLMAEIPEGTVVSRAFALNTARHFSIAGRYIAAMARPDRWISWKFAGIKEGRRLIEKYRPDVIWSTYPIATAHVIALELRRRSGLPWVADFRDPMTHSEYPTDPVTRRQFREIEAEVIDKAALSLFTTPGAARACRERYPERASRVQVLENGYDEESFSGLRPPTGSFNPGGVALLHSGIVYPSERDPGALFIALETMKRQGRVVPGSLKIRFRAPLHDELLRSLAGKHGVEAFVEICPAIPYREALSEMLSADGLLVMQAANCNEQIPAKIYEYLRAGRPVLGLTDPTGDTAGVLREAGIHTTAALDSPSEIVSLIEKFMRGGHDGFLPTPAYVESASRYGRARAFASLLDKTLRDRRATTDVQT